MGEFHRDALGEFRFRARLEENLSQTANAIPGYAAALAESSGFYAVGDSFAEFPIGPGN